MAHIYARHRIEDYETWERFHEANAETRAEHGSTGTRAFRVADDPTEVVVLQAVADDRLEEMLAYYESDAFRETMAEAGVVEVVEADVLERVHEMDV